MESQYPCGPASLKNRGQSSGTIGVDHTGRIARGGPYVSPSAIFEHHDNLLQTMTMPRVTESGWSRKFDEPIPLAKGRQLITLKDAGTYITKLPKAEHTAAEWQAAMEALILVATLGGPTMFARIGIMRALNRHVERVFNPSR
jgi:hypothetical protein